MITLILGSKIPSARTELPTGDVSPVDERIGSAEIGVGKETVREARNELRSAAQLEHAPRRAIAADIGVHHSTVRGARK